MATFKARFDFQSRKETVLKVKTKYENYVPCIIEPADYKQPDIDRNKFIVPKNATFGKLLFEIRKHIKLNPELALFAFVNDIAVPVSLTMIEVYEKYKDEDGFLYITYSLENTFG